MPGDLRTFQARMAKALLAPAGDACPPDFDEPARRRFRVYRNNVQHGLAEALAKAYPTVARLVGAAFFAAMARAFLLARPPRTRSLALFGEGFADFVAGFPPAATLPYLADVARLERAVLEAQHAADARPLTAAALLALGADARTLRLRPHPATRLVASPHPIVALWQSQGPMRIEAVAQHALVTRPDDRVIVQALDPVAGRFALALLGGAASDTARAAADDPSGDDAVTLWQPLLQGGAFRHFSEEERP